MPGPVSLGLQPLQDAARCEGAAGMSAIAIGILWLVHFLPLSVVAALGNGIGAIAFWLIPQRRHVVRVNLQKCFPGLSQSERERLSRAPFKMFFRTLVERGIPLWAP